MNLVGHVHVARGWDGSDPAMWLGSMLPDLAREAGAPVGPAAGWSPAIARGLACHRATDDAFHAGATFRATVADLREALLAAGIGRGPARAVAHAGCELLLDGALVAEDTGLAGTYLAALDVPVDDDRWRAALARRRSHGAPTWYGDPERVAGILQRVLSGRRLLAFDPAQLDAVAAVLAAHQPAVVARSAAMVADALRAPARAGTGGP